MTNSEQILRLRSGQALRRGPWSSGPGTEGSGQAKRTERARLGRWAVARVEVNTYSVMNLDNSGHTYRVVTLGNGDYTCTCKDKELHRSLRCKHGEVVRLLLEGEDLNVQPIVTSDEAGITASYFDGATISLTIGGRSACSKCGTMSCSHLHEAVPFYARWKWLQAQSGRWPGNRLIELGIPPIAVKPGLLGKQWWTPQSVQVNGAKLYALVKGQVVHFQDGGHVFVGELHPDGYTPCLGSDDACKSGECDHVTRAMHICSTTVNEEAVEQSDTPPLTHAAQGQSTGSNGGDVEQNIAPGNQDHITQKKGQHIMSDNGNGANGLIEIMAALAEPFPPEVVKWLPKVLTKDKSKAMAIAYADPRAYEDRLNEVCPDWEVSYQPWNDQQVICHLTIGGVTRASTGEADTNDRNTGTSAEAQAFKRACSKFKLGRYFYGLPTPWMPVEKRGRNYVFTDESLQRLRHFLATGEKPGRQRRRRRRPSGNGSKPGNNGLTVEQARVFVMPFGTRNHPEYEGKTLGTLPADLIEWLAGEGFQPNTESGEQVKVAAVALAKAA